ncbi:ABC transporter ATP-binding protein [Orenia marismortui]|uniref:ABC-2 type transport system ATP-binding protein n=1 Tax=Orenia marismortui TaxID=46469 RepID=A0A4R8H1S6_9FIRM|nr:ATP-binding cassette domain-containing protein [Orenia marismortui]TDX48367.1 ABC-2 type transport system ATP-binding protein [Orenia marismortui]
METIIKVSDLVKTYKVQRGKKGLKGAIKNLFSREYEEVKAVDAINLEINKGEMVGYIGPNGAGKSTTIKMLTGVLQPTSGSVRVNGLDPFRDRIKNAFNIGVVFGQRNQLLWDISVQESFDLFKDIYEIPEDLYQRNLEIFDEMIGLDDIMDIQVRKLSLGMKMKANIVASLLHDPEVVFLDEPTIGLDVMVKHSIRRFLKQVNQEKNTTVILTTHDMDDIEELCDRIIIIDQGNILYDGNLIGLKDEFITNSRLEVELKEAVSIVELFNDEFKINKRKEGLAWEIIFPNRYKPAAIITKIMEKAEVVDVSIEEMSLEQMIKQLYEDKSLGSDN